MYNLCDIIESSRQSSQGLCSRGAPSPQEHDARNWLSFSFIVIQHYLNQLPGRLRGITL